MYRILISSLQVTVLAAVYLLAKPLLRRRVSYTAFWSLISVQFFLLYISFRSSPDFNTALLTLPWPMPHITSPVAALDYPDTSPAWIEITNRIWLIGMFTCLGVGVSSYAVFRIRVARMSRPACAHSSICAGTVYADADFRLA